MRSGLLNHTPPHMPQRDTHRLTRSRARTCFDYPWHRHDRLGRHRRCANWKSHTIPSNSRRTCIHQYPTEQTYGDPLSIGHPQSHYCKYISERRVVLLGNLIYGFRIALGQYRACRETPWSECIRERSCVCASSVVGRTTDRMIVAGVSMSVVSFRPSARIYHNASLTFTNRGNLGD